MINVVKPSTPPLEDFVECLAEIWDSKVFSNSGEFHQRLEYSISEYLDIKNLSLYNNGTTALIAALSAADLEGEVITTPFTFVATLHSLIWNRLTPVFVDIDPETCNIDPLKIENAITDNTSAILAVHCYGNPCDVEAINNIAMANNLCVIYDSAHAFGVIHKGRSLLDEGDFSVLSFHSTKVFHTFEGGAVVTNNAERKEVLDNIKNFGLNDPETAVLALNGKMSEVNAAMGLLQLKYLQLYINRRKEINDIYLKKLSGLEGIRLIQSKGDQHNYSYFPIEIISQDSSLVEAFVEYMKVENINCRRYFYPLVSNMKLFSSYPSADINNLPVANLISSRIVCLPIYPDLSNEDVIKVSDRVRRFLIENITS